MTSPHVASDEVLSTAADALPDHDSTSSIHLTAAAADASLQADPEQEKIPPSPGTIGSPNHATSAGGDSNTGFTGKDEDVKVEREEGYIRAEEGMGGDREDAAIATMPQTSEQIRSPPNQLMAKPMTEPSRIMDLAATYAQPLGTYDGLATSSLQYSGVSQEALLALQGMPSLDNSYLYEHPTLEAAAQVDPVMQNHRVSAYAKLVFEDSEFYMTTYSIVIGRDQRMMKATKRQEQESLLLKDDRQENAKPHTPLRTNQGRKYVKSIVSETGGILRDDDSSEEERIKKRKLKKASKKSKSTGSSSQHVSRRNSLARPDDLPMYQQESQANALVAAAALVDPATLRPSPHECPHVPIHPPNASSADYKSISRDHVTIRFNQRKHLFEAEVLGRNGAFIDEQFHLPSDVVELKSGSTLQIGKVFMQFVLPDVALGETGADVQLEYEDSAITDRYSEGGKEMSFDFEDAPRGAPLDSSDDGSNAGEILEDGEEDEDEDVDDGIEEYEEDIRPSVERGDEAPQDSDQSANAAISRNGNKNGNIEEQNIDPTLKVEKRRGPGRPPKNGVMSKREQLLVKKQALEQGKPKKTLPPASGDPAIVAKKKVGRPRIHPRPESPEVPREKRKYTKRKPKEPKDPNIKGEGSNDDKPAKPKKEKKPKPERSPTPTFNEADLTPEQLAKPSANYVTLIYDALTESKAGQMSLPQLYRAIQRKYPYFVLKTSTSGWQSSVRHNLSQHAAFQKTERDGKGWMWAIVPGTSIEKEKKRRTTPPAQNYPGSHQPIYQAGQPHNGYQYPPNMMPSYPYATPQMPMHGYQGPYLPQQLNGHQYPIPAPMTGQPHAPANIPPAMFAPPPGITQTASSYSSPYAPKPPASTPPQNSPPASQPPLLQNQQSPISQPTMAQPTVSQATNAQSQVGPESQVASQLRVGSQSQNGLQSQPGSQLQDDSQSQPAPQSQPVHQPQIPIHNNTTQPQQDVQIQQVPHKTLASQNPPNPQNGSAGQNAHVSGQAPQVLPQVLSHQPTSDSKTSIQDDTAPWGGFLERFKPIMVSSLMGKSANPEAVVESAINRLLGKTSESMTTGNLQEEQEETRIFETMKNALKGIPLFDYGAVSARRSEAEDQRSVQAHQSPVNNDARDDHAAPKSPTTTGHGVSSPSISRPLVIGQEISIPNGTFLTNALPKAPATETDVVGPQGSALSPNSESINTHSMNGASTTQAVLSEKEPAGQKRAYDSADEWSERETKRRAIEPENAEQIKQECLPAVSVGNP
ncbi:hypothetical protein B0O99DRAFT_685989 [Bisporella sp. PMI_857]|nr:hypothetical protein B0O99DRAFT_685989 [Bisporella sp. PMI_857]